MFDIDRIEKDWQVNSFYLSDTIIMEIFKSEGVTTAEYEKEVANFKNNLPPSPTCEDRLIAIMFHDEEALKKIDDYDNFVKELYETKYPKRKYLTESSQKIIIEGCMDVVFSETRYWYKFFNEKISIEKLYYVCLYSLFETVKYCVHHSTKPCFRAYVKKSIAKSITKNIARWEHITYRHAYYLINHLGNIESYYNPDYETELKLDYEHEEPYSPSFIYEHIKNDSYDVDYISKISSNEFIAAYQKALEELTPDEKKVMELLYDLNGYNDLTVKQVGEFLIVEAELIEKLKKSAIKKLGKNNTLNSFRKFGGNKNEKKQK